ncbi:MAG: rhomboid family intramembrane serine protease [Sphingobacteriales bacterium]|nr:MAG: rhomboid family intramembrane serine protease [Sphingobacteriales bacterium]
MSFTLIIVIVTVLVSALAFRNDELYTKLILWPRRMDNPGEYYRLLTSGFIHADWMHLIFNMFALFIFGQTVEGAFESVGLGQMFFLIMYLTGIVAASLPSFIKNRNNSYYRSLGASGGVAAVLFSFVYFMPWATIYVWFIPMPGIVAAIAYVAYSAYMSRRGGDNVNHDAHLWGAVYGFVFTLLFSPDHGSFFLEQLKHPSFSF